MVSKSAETIYHFVQKRMTVNFVLLFLLLLLVSNIFTALPFLRSKTRQISIGCGIMYDPMLTISRVRANNSRSKCKESWNAQQPCLGHL
jgi:hypothetical protein